MNDTQKDNGNKPAHTIRHGKIKSTIWMNPTERGPMYNATFSRSYQDAEQNWHDTSSFGFNDLLTVAKAAADAHSWISSQKAQDRNGSADEENAQGQKKKAASR